MPTQLHSAIGLNDFLERTGARKPLVVQFTASWCPPCKTLKKLLGELSTEYAGSVDVLVVNTEDSPEIANHCQVRSVPTLLAYRNGHVIATQVGFGKRAPVISLFDELAGHWCASRGSSA